MLSNTSVTATIDAAEEALTMNVRSVQKAAIQLAGTFTATLTFEGTVDGSTWHTVAASVSTVNKSGGAVVTTAAAAGLWTLDVTEYSYVRARCSAYTSGTITAKGYTAFAGPKLRG